MAKPQARPFGFTSMQAVACGGAFSVGQVRCNGGDRALYLSARVAVDCGILGSSSIVQSSVGTESPFWPCSLSPQTVWTQQHTAVITSTGRLAVWGHGYSGQLGTGKAEDKRAPILVGGALADVSVRGVACGNRHTACVTADGRLFTWGHGGLGALGHGGTAGRMQPSEVKALSGVKRVAVVSCCADHTAVCTVDGCVFTWGAGAFGQLGHGDAGSKLVPFQVLGELRGRHVVTIATGNCHTASVTREGHLFAWGDATFGQLGLGGTEGKLAPQQVGAELANLSTKSVACGHYHTVAATQDGRVFAWGDGQQGQLGLGSREGRSYRNSV